MDDPGFVLHPAGLRVRPRFTSEDATFWNGGEGLFATLVVDQVLWAYTPQETRGSA